MPTCPGCTMSNVEEKMTRANAAAVTATAAATATANDNLTATEAVEHLRRRVVASHS